MNRISSSFAHPVGRTPIRSWMLCVYILCVFKLHDCVGRSFPSLGARLVRQQKSKKSRFESSCDVDDECATRSAFSYSQDESHGLKQLENEYNFPSGRSSIGNNQDDDEEYDALMESMYVSAAPPQAPNSMVRSYKRAQDNGLNRLSKQVTSARLTVSKRTKQTQVDEASARGGAAASLVLQTRPLVFWENMVCGAVSRSVAQTIMHPANTMKTILQSTRGIDRPTIRTLARRDNFRTLTRGAGANFILSVPHGAINFAILELIRFRMNKIVQKYPRLSNNADRLGPGLDFLSSALSTITCSVVSTPQMMITDNIMAGNYPNLPQAVVGLAKDRGIHGFYAGWWPGLAGKIPSYALTWTFFQQLKRIHASVFQRSPYDIENSAMGCIASATTVCIMIPMDTVKTRLVTQTSRIVSDPYLGIVDCFFRVFREEGIGAFYRGLAPRLVSVVPMIGIQFGVYEFAKKTMLQRTVKPRPRQEDDAFGLVQAIEEAAMETAADQDQPFPAPRFKTTYKVLFPKKDKKKRKWF